MHNKRQCLVSFNNLKDDNYENFQVLLDCGAYKAHTYDLGDEVLHEYVFDIEEIEDIGRFVDRVNAALRVTGTLGFYSPILSFDPLEIFLDKV